MANGKFAIYNVDENYWYRDGQEYDIVHMTGEWTVILTDTYKIWSDNKLGKVDTACVCTTIDLFNFGCPVDRTGKCRSKK